MDAIGNRWLVSKIGATVNPPAEGVQPPQEAVSAMHTHMYVLASKISNGETLKKIGLHINGYRLLVAFFVYGNNHLKTMLHEKFIQQSTGTHGEINSFVDETTILFAKAPFGCRVIQAAIDTLPRKQQLELIKNGLKLTESVKAM